MAPCDIHRIGDIFIEEKRPLLQAKTQKDTFLITSVNTGRKENALTLYTSAYGPSTKTNDFGYEVTVANGKVVSGQKEILKLEKTNMYYLGMENQEMHCVN